MAYRYERTLNNNAIVAVDETGEEAILLGRGIALHCSRGRFSTVRDDLIERVFTLERGGDPVYYGQLVAGLPLELVQLVEDVIAEAGRCLGFDFQNRLTLTLLDHIVIARDRDEVGETLPNPLLDEIRLFYPKEYRVASASVRRLNEQLGTHFDSNEVAFIALHYINAMSSVSQGVMKRVMGALGECVAAVEGFYGARLNRSSSYYTRFITHLKFFLSRVFAERRGHAGEKGESTAGAVLLSVRDQDPRAWACASSVGARLEREYGIHVSEEETAYLALHIALMLGHEERS